MMRSLIIFFSMGFFAAALMATSSRESLSANMELCVNKFKADAKQFSKSAFNLQEAIEQISATDSGSVITARQVLADCRVHYKSLEFFLEYFFPTAAVTYNMPPKVEVEVPNIELSEPTGLQVIEAALYEKDVFAHKKDILLQMEVINSSAEDIHSLLFNFQGNEKQLLESMRLELIRIMAIGVTGFDAALLKTGIRESYAALASVNEALQPLLENYAGHTDSVSFYMQRSLSFLQASTDFDNFDRLQFLTGYVLPLQYHFGKWIRQAGMELNSTKALNYTADNLFSKDQFIKKSFSSSVPVENNTIINLGKALFFDKSLSGNGLKSCASCHKPSLYYTDGLAKSRAFDEHLSLSRNAPSIMYSVFQYEQGWDGSVPGLEEQVIKVLSSPEEMNATYEVIVRRLQHNTTYRQLFDKSFSTQGDSSISINNVASAIAAFVRTCTPFNAAFDRYLQGDNTALTAAAKRGFNLFMGKAQCGTCHFAPLFNGLTPPLYDLSEAEVIGVPATEQLDKPASDTDRGRYNVYPISVYDKAFKTPGLRNIAKTAPYMHNGSFSTLKQVLNFYNRGGSQGIGLPLPNQTLSAQPLKLTEQDMADIISFMEALTDPLPSDNINTTYPDKSK